jgi:hypothetical protein
VVIGDTLHTFGWNRQPDPNDYEGNGPAFRFVDGATLNGLIPWWANPDKDDPQANLMYAARRDFGGSGLGNTKVVKPWDRLVQIYARYIYLRGTLLAIIVLIGAAGVVARWRRWGGLGLLPWLVAAALMVLPPMTAGFSYRYVLAAVPVACLAAGLAFARLPGEKSVLARGDDPAIPPRPHRSVGALAADLRRHLGGGGGVEQE